MSDHSKLPLVALGNGRFLNLLSVAEFTVYGNGAVGLAYIPGGNQTMLHDGAAWNVRRLLMLSCPDYAAPTTETRTTEEGI